MHVSLSSEPSGIPHQLHFGFRKQSYLPVRLCFSATCLQAQVLATTAGLANMNKSRLTVLMVDKAASGAEGTSWIEAASW